MKTKTFILLAIVAVITLSFTFASRKNNAKKEKTTQENEPIGGFVSESSF